MLESYIIARDRFLKPGGKMFPTLGRCATFATFAYSATFADFCQFWYFRHFRHFRRSGFGIFSFGLGLNFWIVSFGFTGSTSPPFRTSICMRRLLPRLSFGSSLVTTEWIWTHYTKTQHTVTSRRSHPFHCFSISMLLRCTHSPFGDDLLRLVHSNVIDLLGHTHSILSLGCVCDVHILHSEMIYVDGSIQMLSINFEDAMPLFLIPMWLRCTHFDVNVGGMHTLSIGTRFDVFVATTICFTITTRTILLTLLVATTTYFTNYYSYDITIQQQVLTSKIVIHHSFSWNEVVMYSFLVEVGAWWVWDREMGMRAG